MDYIRYLRGMIGNKPAIFVAAVILIRDSSGRLLLQRRSDDGTWGVVGGIMNLGETVEEAARREVFEETGLELRYFALDALPEPIFPPNLNMLAAIKEKLG